MAARTREKWAYRGMGRQYTQMSLGMALDVVMEGREESGWFPAWAAGGGEGPGAQ